MNEPRQKKAEGNRLGRRFLLVGLTVLVVVGALTVMIRSNGTKRSEPIAANLGADGAREQEGSGTRQAASARPASHSLASMGIEEPAREVARFYVGMAESLSTTDDCSEAARHIHEQVQRRGHVLGTLREARDALPPETRPHFETAMHSELEPELRRMGEQIQRVTARCVGDQAFREALSELAASGAG